MDHVLQCTNYIKQSYIKNHVLRFSRWPPCQLNSPATPPDLLHAYLGSVDPDSRLIVEKYGKTSPRDYVFVDLLPNMRFEKLDPIIPHLKDKTKTVLRSRILSG